jgi:hypothetical protein
VNFSLDVTNCPEEITTPKNPVDNAAEDLVSNIKCLKKALSLQMSAIT